MSKMKSSPAADFSPAEFADALEAASIGRYIEALRNGDDAEAVRLGQNLDFSPKTIAMHKVALDEHRELSAAAAPLQSCRDKITAINRKLACLVGVRCETAEQAIVLDAKVQEFEGELCKENNALNEALIANAKLNALERWAGPLFGHPEADCSQSLYTGMKTVDACSAIGVESSVRKAWRGNQLQESRPRRRLRAVK